MSILPTKKKKVLYLITKSNWGGAQRYVYDLATHLDTAKFKPVVALGGDGPLVDMLKNANINLINLAEMQNSTSLKQAWRSYQELANVIKTEKPDVLHLNSSIAGLVGALAGRLARVPTIIFTAHGWAFNEDRPLWQKMIIKFLHYSTVLLAHRTIAVSSAIVTQMNWPGAAKRMKIINPGRTIGPMYDRTQAREKMVDFYPSLKSYSQDYWLVCIAELHPIKRHKVVLAALTTLIQTRPATRLIIIGDGLQRTAIEKQILTLGLTNNVFILGNIVEAARFLKAFDAFVLASKSESYGYVIHEAGLAGVPIVATNVGGIPDIIKTREDGILIEPDNATLLAQALSALQTDRDAATTRALHLKQRLDDQTVIKMTRQTESLYGL